MLVEAAGLDQRLAQWRLELAAEVGKFLAIVGVQHFQPQATADWISRQVLQQYADTIRFRKLQVLAARPLPRKDQFGETQLSHQPLGAAAFAADEFRTGTLGPRLGVAGHFQDGGVLADFRAYLALETGAAMQQQCVHVRILSAVGPAPKPRIIADHGNPRLHDPVQCSSEAPWVSPLVHQPALTVWAQGDEECLPWIA